MDRRRSDPSARVLDVRVFGIRLSSSSTTRYPRTSASAPGAIPNCCLFPGPPPAVSMSTSDDVDPRQFLERMRTMSDQRDQQDAERIKKLEEELIQGRSERLARRAGMALCNLATLTLYCAGAYRCTRTRTLAVARQADDAPIASLPCRYTAKRPGEACRNAHAEHGAALAGERS